jgi:hypothetical protein
MGLWYFELFLKNQIFALEVNFVFIVLGESEVIFVEANSLLVLEENVDVSLSEFVWYL